MRLIDADALSEVIEDMGERFRKRFFVVTAKAYSEIPPIVNAMPTIDAVEVVRCKDCRRYKESAESRTRFCRRGLNYQYAVPDGFCSYGERKTDDKRTDSTDRA